MNMAQSIIALVVTAVCVGCMALLAVRVWCEVAAARAILHHLDTTLEAPLPQSERQRD